MGKLINRIQGSRLLISSLSGSALRTHVESLGKPRDVNMRSKKHCLVNLISKETHLVFSISPCMLVSFPLGATGWSVIRNCDVPCRIRFFSREKVSITSRGLVYLMHSSSMPLVR